MRITRRSLRDPAIIGLLLSECFTEPASPRLVPCRIDRCVAVGAPMCDLLGFRHRRPEGAYCSYPSWLGCAYSSELGSEGFRRRDAFESPPLVLDIERHERLPDTPLVRKARATLALLIERIAREPEGSHGMTARAMLSDDWSEVDATRPKRREPVEWRIIAQQTLHARLAAEIEMVLRREG